MYSSWFLCIVFFFSKAVETKILNDAYNIYDLSQCPLQIEPIGCYADSREKRMFPDEIMNSRDSTSTAFSLSMIGWKGFNHWLSNYICECGKKLLSKKNVAEDYIGVQFYAECWGNLAQNEKPKFEKESSKCVDGNYQPFYASNLQRCHAHMGQGNSNFVYKVSKFYRTCPEVKGTFISTSSSFKLEMVDDINIKGDWLTNSRPQFSGEFLRGCHGKLMFNDDKAYSFDYNTKTCTLTMDNGEVLTKKNCEKVEECPYYKSYGCYKDLEPRKDPNFEIYAFNERDQTNENWTGRYVDWKNWGKGYLVDLLCRCAQEALKKKKRFFSIQYLGECWITNNEEKIKRHGKGSKCFDKAFNICKEGDNMCKPNVCAGDSSTNKVYEIHQGPLKCLENPCPKGKRCIADGLSSYACV